MPVDLGVDLLVGHLQAGQGDHQPLVAGDGHGRPHQHHGVEGDRPCVLARGDVDLRLVDGVDLGVADRPGVEGRQRLTERLAPQGGRPAHAGLDDPAGHLAGSEPGDPDVPGQSADHLVERLVDLRLFDLDGETDLVALFGLGCGSHTNCRVYRYRGTQLSRRGRRCPSPGTASPGGRADRRQIMKAMDSSTRWPRAMSPSIRTWPVARTLAGATRPESEPPERLLVHGQRHRGLGIRDARDQRRPAPRPPARPPSGP